MVKGRQHYEEDDQKLDYGTDSGFADPGDPNLRAAQREHPAEQPDVAGAELRGGTGEHQRQRGK